MEDFPFLLNLNYKMNDFEIKPPRSLRNLKEITNEKYDLTYNELIYYTEEGEEKDLITEQDYAELLDYATENNLDQVEIIVKKNEKNTSQKRKESLRKKSSMKNEYEGETYSKKQSKLHSIKDADENDNENENSESDDEISEKGGNNGGDEEVGMKCDYDYFGDTRNRKAMCDEGYNKHNKGFKEDKRIGYIKEKKQRQREEDLKNNQVEEVEEEEDRKNQRKRKRNKNQIDENDEEYGNNYTEPTAKNNKKKKKGKKDKVRF